MKRIATSELKASDIPNFDGDWMKAVDGSEDISCIEFALSFSGDVFTGDYFSEYLAVANDIRSLYATSPKVLDCFGITGLRLLLYLEQRSARWNNVTSVSRYVQAIVKSLRKRL